MASPKSIKNIKLSLLHTYDIPKAGLSGYKGCTIHLNGKLILTDNSRFKLIVLNNDGTVDKDIPCSSGVNDVTTIDDRTVAVATFNGIDIINIDSKRKEQVIKTSSLCYGITHHKGTLLWCEVNKGIQRMDLTDWSINTLVKQDQLYYNSHVTTHGDKIYQTNEITKTVTCYSMNREIVWEYKNQSVLKDPTCITVDNNGNIYVTSFCSNNVVVISADGKEGRKILSETKGIQRPFGIYYQKANNNVLIVNRDGPALLYHAS